MAPILQNIGGALERSNSAQNSLVQSYPSIIGIPIRDFISYIEVVQEIIKKRESYQWAYENSLEELNKCHDDKNKLIACSSGNQQQGFSLWKQPSCDEKLEKLGVYIPQILKKVEANQDSLECANESLRSDLEHWQIEKQQCLKKILQGFVNKQIEYYQAAVNAWEHVVNEIGGPQNHSK